MVELFESFKIGSLGLKNRFVRSATWDGTADNLGVVTDSSVALYEELGRGGIGLIVTGHAFVSPLGQATPGQYGIHTDDMIPSLHRLVKASQRGDTKIAVQITHSGINSFYLRRQGKLLRAVSKVDDMNRLHQEMTDAEIEAIIADFASAARRAVEAGFDSIQLHGAHGYLMSQFLSPRLNKRTDRWGGSNENRRRFHLEVIKRIRQTIGPDFPLMIKFGVQDDVEGGLPLSEGVETARQMVEQGIDAIEVSAGDGRRAVPAMTEGETEQAFFRERAAAVKKVVTVPVMLAGGIRSLQLAGDIVNSGDADLISMCRPFIREPDLLLRWQKSGKESAKCISCNKCMPMRRTLSCNEERRLREETNT